MNKLTPLGVRDLLPEETQKYQGIIKKLTQIFESEHYQHIQTPTLEYFDALALGMGPHFKDIAVKFFDPKGQVLVLRPDHTVPIARLIATRMQGASLPLKLHYINSIFRQHHDTHDIETVQGGIELIGEKGPQADAAVIVLAIKTLKALGIEDFGIDIGHTDFISGLSVQEQDALLKGDYVALGRIPFRGKEEAISHHPELQKIHALLKAEGLDHYVHFNQGLVKELHYYTGLIFECYLPQTRQSVGSGGRYDSLLEKFGFSCPAVGFALNINHLAEAL